MEVQRANRNSDPSQKNQNSHIKYQTNEMDSHRKIVCEANQTNYYYLQIVMHKTKLTVNRQTKKKCVTQ